VHFCVLESSECRLPSLLGGGSGRVGADLGRVVFVALACSTVAAAGFFGCPALPNGDEILAARVEVVVGLTAGAAFPSIRFGAIARHDLTTGLQRSAQFSAARQVCARQSCTSGASSGRLPSVAEIDTVDTHIYLGRRVSLTILRVRGQTELHPQTRLRTRTNIASDAVLRHTWANADRS
jgi:hypothetical protein